MKLIIEVEFTGDDVPLDVLLEWLPEVRDKVAEMGRVTRADLVGFPPVATLGWARVEASTTEESRTDDAD